MQTVTYYVLKNKLGLYMDRDVKGSTKLATCAAMWSARVCAQANAGTAYKVVKVTRTVKPRKTHDRKWAMRQLLRGKTITNVVWVNGASCRITAHGIRYFSQTTGFDGDSESLSCPDGYMLAP